MQLTLNKKKQTFSKYVDDISHKKAHTSDCNFSGITYKRSRHDKKHEKLKKRRLLLEEQKKHFSK